MAQDRYHRQVLLPQIGPEGQERLKNARVMVLGCGALGSVMAEQLVRAGVGYLRLVDRDIVEMSNLQRQVLFEEKDAIEGNPKALAAAGRLRRINSQVEIESLAIDVHAENIEDLISQSKIDLIFDGTDNAQTRYLINDVSVRSQIPWIYGGCVGTEGRVMAFAGVDGPCLRCVFPQMPGPGELATCDTAGVLGSAVSVVASLQVIAGMQVLLKTPGKPKMLIIDAWSGRIQAIDMVDVKRDDCVCCGLHRFEFLEAKTSDSAIELCGRDAIQIRPPVCRIDLTVKTKDWQKIGQVTQNPFFVRCILTEPAGVVLTLFPDGRAIIQGVTDPTRAKSIYARFVGR